MHTRRHTDTHRDVHTRRYACARARTHTHTLTDAQRHTLQVTQIRGTGRQLLVGSASGWFVRPKSDRFSGQRFCRPGRCPLFPRSRDCRLLRVLQISSGAISSKHLSEHAGSLSRTFMGLLSTAGIRPCALSSRRLPHVPPQATGAALHVPCLELPQTFELARSAEAGSSGPRSRRPERRSRLRHFTSVTLGEFLNLSGFI